jgi:8-hydroxy-5-deazaflavin:NADPH oxidoreductase
LKVGVIGAGGIGTAFARQASRAGHDVLISNSRGPASLAALVGDLGRTVRSGTPKEASQAEIVLLAVPWRHLPQAVEGLAPWGGRIVLDATNPLGPPDFQVADLGGRTSSEVVADLVPGARLVKAFNTLPPRLLAADPGEGGGRRVLFFSGDDAPAKAAVGRLIDSLGFAGIDLGGLVSGGRLHQFPGGPLPALNLVRLPS